jgi:hypothetical protein
MRQADVACKLSISPRAPSDPVRSVMPTDETRRLLKTFGVAITTLEDAVHDKASADEIAKAERQARAMLDEVTSLIDRLRDEAKSFRV